MRKSGGLGLFLLATAGCAAPAPAPRSAPRQPPPPVVSAAPARPPLAAPEDAELISALSAAAVFDDDFARRELYTWTTDQQAAEIAKGRRLLTKSRADDGSMSWFDQQMAARKDAPARLLQRRELSLRRFAWPAPWATLLGFQGESYGTRLVRVRLRPEAIIARFDAANPEPWAFTDLKGQPVSEADVLALPERLAAVYHVWSARSADGSPFPYREMVLVNESMIESWELGGARLDQVREDSRKLARALSALAPGDEPDADFARRAREAWRARPSRMSSVSLESAYLAALAFSGPQYRPDAVGPSLSAALDKVPEGEPAVRVTPSTRFADQGAPAPPPKPRPKNVPFKCWGTLC